MPVDRIKIKREIMLKMQRDPEAKAEIDFGTKKVALEVKEYWQTVAWPESAAKGQWSNHPYETGSYVDSIEIRQNRNRRGHFMAGWTVFTNHPHANFIEFGTGPDKPGSRSPWGPRTPTPEFGPAGITEFHFGGTDE
jgi:hypothetical protein